MEQMNAFIEYLYTVEESIDSLTQDQVEKLHTIQSKVMEIVKKVQSYPVATNVTETAPAQQTVRQPELAVAENRIKSFSDFIEINEKIVHQDGKWLVKNKAGDKVLGTHDTKKEALAQLRAIEISKAQHG